MYSVGPPFWPWSLVSMEIGHGHVCFLASSYKRQDCRSWCGVSSIPQAHEGEVSILILYRCLFRRQCLVRRCVICWFGPISTMCGTHFFVMEGGKRGGWGGERELHSEGTFIPVKSLSSHIESHWHLPLPFCLPLHFLGFRSELVSIAGQLGDIGKAFLASWSGQVTCLQLEPPRLIWLL